MVPRGRLTRPFLGIEAIRGGLPLERAAGWALTHQTDLGHQILQRNASERTIGESAPQPQAFANDGIFDTGPFALKLLSGCGLVATIMRPYSGRKLPAQICANARKKR